MGDGTTCHECRQSHKLCECPEPVGYRRPQANEIKAAAERLVTNDYHGDGGNIIDANRQRRADEKLVAEAYLRLIKQQ